MKKTFIIAAAFVFCCFFMGTAQAKNYNKNLTVTVAWPQAVTFSKKQMTRLDIMDPSYAKRLEGMMKSDSSPFSSWKKRISAAVK